MDASDSVSSSGRDSVTAYSARTAPRQAASTRPRSSRSASGAVAVRREEHLARRARQGAVPERQVEHRVGEAGVTPVDDPGRRPGRVHQHVPQVEVPVHEHLGSRRRSQPGALGEQRVERAVQVRPGTPLAVASQPVEGLTADRTPGRRRGAAHRVVRQTGTVHAPPAAGRAAAGGRHRCRQRAGLGRPRGAARRGPRPRAAAGRPRTATGSHRAGGRSARAPARRPAAPRRAPAGAGSPCRRGRRPSADAGTAPPRCRPRRTPCCRSRRPARRRCPARARGTAPRAARGPRGRRVRAPRPRRCPPRRITVAVTAAG